MSVINPLEMPAPVRSYFEAMNRYDRDGVVRAFAEDALVNDVQREFWGSESISRWTEKEIVGEKVIATKFVAAKTDYGDYIVSAEFDGDFDKTGLPDPLGADALFLVARQPHHSTHHPSQQARLLIDSITKWPTSDSQRDGEALVLKMGQQISVAV